MKTIYKISLLLSACLVLNISCSSDKTTDNDTGTEETPKDKTSLASVNTMEAKDVAAFRAVVTAKIESNGGSSVTEQGICYALTANPDYDDNRKNPSTVKGSGEFETELNDLEQGANYYARAYAKNSKGIAYGNEISFTTLTPVPPEFEVGEVKVSGPHDIWTDIKITEQGEDKIVEVGVLFSKNESFDIDSGTKLKQDALKPSFKYRLTDLEADTKYYYKPYAITAHDKVHYGETVAYNTRVQGNFTWGFNGTLNMENEDHKRIKEAFDKATWYYSNYTSIQKHVTVNFSPGTPTADANFGGWINVGANPGYQRTGTAMHEMAHTVGVGTHWTWQPIIDNDDSYYDHSRANEVITMMTDGRETEVHNAGIHFWPYGINGAHEDSGDDFLYIMNALLVQAFNDEGLPYN